MANYRKKRRYSGCYMCKPHKRFPKSADEGRGSELRRAEQVKEQLKDV